MQRKFSSTANREILSQLNGKTLSTKKFVNAAAAKAKDQPKDPKTLPKKIRDQRLNDPRETFNFAFKCIFKTFYSLKNFRKKLTWVVVVGQGQCQGQI